MYYHFSILLAGEKELTEELAERLFQVCHDITPSSSDGVAKVTFHRESESLEAAIRGAVSDLAQAGCRPGELRMSPDALVAV